MTGDTTCDRYWITEESPVLGILKHRGICEVLRAPKHECGPDAIGFEAKDGSAT